MDIRFAIELLEFPQHLDAKLTSMSFREWSKTMAQKNSIKGSERVHPENPKEGGNGRSCLSIATIATSSRLLAQFVPNR